MPTRERTTLSPEVDMGLLAKTRRDHRQADSTRHRRRLPVGLAVASLGLVLAAIVLATGGGYTNVESALRDGAHPLAPVIPLPQIGSSRRLSLADYRGHVVILSFYATWCSPDCTVGLPALTQVNRELRAAHSGTVILDDYKDLPSALPASMPAMKDLAGALANAFGIIELPGAFAIDKRGRVVAFANGAQSLRQLRVLVARASK